MESESNILLNLAIIIFLSKILGAISTRFKQPPVIGMLILGVVLGPTVFHLIEPNEIINWIGKLGALFLLFEAGLETDIKRIKADSKQAMLPAIGGIILPFSLGFLISWLVSHDVTQSLVLGVIFTATSVSVSVMTLIDLNKLKGIEGRCIVNAAIIDDIVGIILLTFIFGVTSNVGGGITAMAMPLLKIAIFFVFSLAVGLYVLKPIFVNLKKIAMDNVVVSLAIAVVLLYSWFAEHNGLAAITGAYFAGIIMGQTNYRHQIQEGMSTVGKSFFVDVFFVSIGLEFNLLEIEAEPIFLISFILLAVLGKIIGSGLGARLAGMDNIRATRIGVGMIPRGEVALIVSNMAVAKNLIHTDILSATILMVIVSAVLTPFLMKFVFTKFEQKAF